MAQPTTTSTRTFMTPPPKKEDKSTKKRRLGLGKTPSQLIIIGLVVFSVFMVVQYRDARHKLQANTTSSTKQVDNVIANVGKLIILPKGETPTVAKIINADKLKSQSFFVNAKNGDQLLIYGHDKLAILYRPSTNQLVKVGNLTVTPTGSSTTPTP